MTRTFESILREVLPEIENGMSEFLLENRRETVTKREFKKGFRKYSKRMSLIQHEKMPLVMLVQKVIQANDLIGFTKNLALRKNRFSTEPIVLDGAVTKGIVDEFESPIKEILAPLIQEDPFLLSSTEKSRELHRSNVRHILLPHVFMSVWTALESYLQDRIRARVFSSEEAFGAFVKQVHGKRLPDRWRQSGKPVIVADYFDKMPELIEQYLEFPYGNLRKDGNVEDVYRQCFGFKISKYPKIGKLRKISTLRNTVVHEGTNWFWIPIVSFEYGWLRKFELLVLDFVEWIESQIADNDKREKLATQMVV